eukprot:GEMP01124815.1.p1 GENE.GEMP01124815.1~~GEMP01124815.1.p1  ORF type:complete len:121 (+),score=34.40 GEMP01124815.1:60-422(+)
MTSEQPDGACAAPSVGVEEPSVVEGADGGGIWERCEAMNQIVDPASVLAYCAETFLGHASLVVPLSPEPCSRQRLAEPALGITPLHRASFRGHLVAVQSLLAAQASVFVFDHAGDTPLQA